MKATVDAGAFFKALNRVIPLLKVSAIPALSEASIQFRDGVCTITATDLELWVQTEIPAEGGRLWRCPLRHKVHREGREVLPWPADIFLRGRGSFIPADHHDLRRQKRGVYRTSAEGLSGAAAVYL